MSTPYRIYAYASTDLAAAQSCDVSIDENAGAAGTITCPDGTELTLIPQADTYEVIDAANRTLATFDRYTEAHLIIRPDADAPATVEVAPDHYTAEAVASTFAPAQTRTHYQRKTKGSHFVLEGGGSAVEGAERTTLAPDLNGLPGALPGNAFAGTGVHLSANFFAPGKGRSVLTPFGGLRADGAWGSAGPEFTARGDERGRFTRLGAGLEVGLELDFTRLFTGNWWGDAHDFSAHVYGGWRATVVGLTSMTGRFAEGDWALARDVDHTDIRWWPQYEIFAGVDVYTLFPDRPMGLVGFVMPGNTLEDGAYRDRFTMAGVRLVLPLGRDTALTASHTTERLPVQLRQRAPAVIPVATATADAEAVAEAVADAEPAPAPEPEPAPPITVLPEFAQATMDAQSPWQDQTTTHLQSGKVSLLPSERTLVDQLLARANARWSALPNNGLGWKIVVETTGHADTRGDTRRNDTLSLGRAHSLNGQIVQRAADGGYLFITPGHVRAIGRGEREALDLQGQVIPGLTTSACREGAVRGDTRLHQCFGTSYEEDLVNSRRADTEIRFIPPGAPLLQTTADTEPTQLARDRALGPKFAAALRGKGKFLDAVYDAQTNRLLLSVDTLDPATLVAQRDVLYATARKMQLLHKAESAQTPVSFPVEIVLHQDAPPAIFTETLQQAFYDFATFPFAGGLYVSSIKTGAQLASLQELLREADQDAADTADLLFSQRATIADHTMIAFPLKSTDASLEPIVTTALYKLVHLALEARATVPGVTLAINHPDPVAREAIKNLAGYAVQSATGQHPALFTSDDDRLGARIWLIVAPTASPLALDAESPASDAVRAAMLE